MSVEPLSGGPLSSPEQSGDSGMSPKELELQRKRARDRKSQQAMRDRNRWALQNLSDQVALLTAALDARIKDIGLLEVKMTAVEAENARLRAENAALQLSMLGRHWSPDLGAEINTTPWKSLPLSTAPTCIADRILQTFIDAERVRNASLLPDQRAAMSDWKPNLTSLLYKEHRTDGVSNVAGDIIRSYKEIETIPKKVAVFYVIAMICRWLVCVDKPSWDLLPPWLRPIPSQLIVPHATWVDRIPWPKAREYLVHHPEITLDDFASTYSSSFAVKWRYDPAHVLISLKPGDPDCKDVIINPVYEDEIRQLRNWDVGDAFRKRFPEMAALIDEDSNTPVNSLPNAIRISFPCTGPIK